MSSSINRLINNDSDRGSACIWSNDCAVINIMNLMDDYQPWLCSIVASVAIGLSGVLPVLIVPKHSSNSSANNDSGVPAKTLRLLLSFAVGGLLGDVFLHLLPEAWNHLESVHDSDSSRHRLTSYYVTIGMWVLAGVFTFIVVEMMFDIGKATKTSTKSQVMSSLVNCHNENAINGIKSSKSSNSKGLVKNGGPVASNGCGSRRVKQQNNHVESHQMKSKIINVAGYLNLLANSIDNFAHGLAVAGSFLVSFKVGLLTTFAILIHEIPHEIGDFAILMKSGFNRLEAVKAQMATATLGLAGAIAALSVDSAQTLGERTAWILPFTAGGFLHIALINVLPEILQEKDHRESIKQVACLLAGIGVMAFVTIVAG